MSLEKICEVMTFFLQERDPFAWEESVEGVIFFLLEIVVYDVPYEAILSTAGVEEFYEEVSGFYDVWD